MRARAPTQLDDRPTGAERFTSTQWGTCAQKTGRRVAGFAVTLTRHARRPDVRRIMRVQALAAVSQVTAALQLVALLLAVGPGRASDTYVILFSASQVSVSVFVIGGLQPLTISRPGYSGWARWIAAGSIANAILLAATGGFLLAADYPTAVVLPTAGVLMASGACAVTAAVWSVHYAARGRPGVLASITTIPNIVAAVFVVAAPVAKVPVMCLGLLVGNIVTCALLRGHEEEAPALATHHSARLPRRDVAGLLASSSVGAGGPFALQAVTATYSPGQATILGFASRIAAGVVSVGITAFINATTDWTRQSNRPMRLVTQFGYIGVGVGFVLLSLFDLAGVSGIVTAGVAATAFVAGAAAQACAGRALALGGLLASFRRMAAINVPLYGLGMVALSVGAHTATTYFAVIAGITVVSGLVFSSSLGWRRERASLVGLSAVAMSIFAVALLARA